MPPEIDALFDDETPAAYAVYKYCCSCVAHRILKIGWEPQLNYYTARRLILTGMFLPVHARLPLIKEAYSKALRENDTRVLKLLNEQFEVKEKAAV